MSTCHHLNSSLCQPHNIIMKGCYIYLLYISKILVIPSLYSDTYGAVAEINYKRSRLERFGDANIYLIIMDMGLDHYDILGEYYGPYLSKMEIGRSPAHQCRNSPKFINRRLLELESSTRPVKTNETHNKTKNTYWEAIVWGHSTRYSQNKLSQLDSQTIHIGISSICFIATGSGN